MKLIDLYQEDLRTTSNVHVRQAARRYWFRAVCVTLSERSISDLPIPRRSTASPNNKQGWDIPNELRHLIPRNFPVPETSFKPHVERCRHFWEGVDEEELWELFDYLKPYFKRKENLHIRLDE